MLRPTSRLPSSPACPVRANPDLPSNHLERTMAKATEESKAATADQQGQQVRVRWNTTALKSSYANFCNATSTREEVVLNFGVNHNWERSPQEMEIDLEHRIVLSPFAAKRLTQLLSKLITEYESRYGELK
jgi:hypothetical protein